MNKKLTNKKMIFYMILIVFVITSMISIGFSALDSSLSVTGDLVYRKDENIRITGLKVSSQTSDAINLYTPKYTTNKLIVGINLPNIDSEITYEIDITNYSSSNMCLESINNLIYSNELIEYEIVNLDYNQKIPGGGYLLKANITFRYKDKSILPTNTKLDATIQFNFKEYISGSLITSYSCANVNSGLAPYNFTYTGNCEVIDDGDNNWRVKFLTSGDLIFNNLGNAVFGVDVFLVGGGGSGGARISGGSSYGGGGGGGHTNTLRNLSVMQEQSYKIVVGDGGKAVSSAASYGKEGGSTSAFGVIAKGGKGGNVSEGAGGSGGSGGGEANGNGGSDGSSPSGTGQNFTTREFGEVNGELYAGGGGGGVSGKGGAGGGGNGGSNTGAGSGVVNTGGGGGGAGGNSGSATSGAGGSGIVIIRNSRIKNEIKENTIPNFTYTGIYQIIYDNNLDETTSDNWKIRFLTSGTLTFTELNSVKDGIDVFLVGGGGSGGARISGSSNFGGGGGSGHTDTLRNLSVKEGQSYEIVVGAGGETVSGDARYGKEGEATSAFGVIAKGGKGGNVGEGAGGSGGSGGGEANGNGGSDGSSPSGVGQETTTREFGEINGELYAGGGGGGISGKGGAGGGGAGGSNTGGSDGVVNTGGGGGGSGGNTGTTTSGAGGSGIVIIRNARTKINIDESTLPKFTYTGVYQLVYDNNLEGATKDNWKIRFVTSGTLTFTELNSAKDGIDVFLVGGGGSGGARISGSSNFGGGGGSGHTDTLRNLSVIQGQSYEIVVGAGGESVSGNGLNGRDGEDTSAFGTIAKGGKGGNASKVGGNGGSGGGGANGNGGFNGSSASGAGQGKTTREFEDANGELYAGGGGGGISGKGGAGGGGSGGSNTGGSDGVVNTGGGGGGSGGNTGTTTSGAGGSGIVIIRNARTKINIDESTLPKFTYTGVYQLVYDNNLEGATKDNWKIRFLTSGTLTFTELNSAIDGIDVFLVGGGGSGGARVSSSSDFGGGGGSGYTNTLRNISVIQGQSYEIVVGAGGESVSGNGLNGRDGEDTSAFGTIAKGGKGGNASKVGGNGGSGGGGANGNGGFNGSSASGAGQGKTTREFEDANGELYAGGGGGGISGKGGAGGGGSGGSNTGGSDGVANTGGGGGGGGGDKNGTTVGGAGGSGIVIIRNKR